MFQHFGQRLKRDLKQLVDRRLEDNATSSGSQVRSSGVEVDVISHKRQRYVYIEMHGNLEDLPHSLHQLRCVVRWFPHGIPRKFER